MLNVCPGYSGGELTFQQETDCKQKAQKGWSRWGGGEQVRGGAGVGGGRSREGGRRWDGESSACAWTTRIVSLEPRPGRATTLRGRTPLFFR